jgi:hypothetical protein
LPGSDRPPDLTGTDVPDEAKPLAPALKKSIVAPLPAHLMRPIIDVSGLSKTCASGFQALHVPALSALSGVLERSTVAFGSWHRGISV